jgi:hypothetical protein
MNAVALLVTRTKPATRQHRSSECGALLRRSRDVAGGTNTSVIAGSSAATKPASISQGRHSDGATPRRPPMPANRADHARRLSRSGSHTKQTGTSIITAIQRGGHIPVMLNRLAHFKRRGRPCPGHLSFPLRAFLSGWPDPVMAVPRGFQT